MTEKTGMFCNPRITRTGHFFQHKTYREVQWISPTKTPRDLVGFLGSSWSHPQPSPPMQEMRRLSLEPGIISHNQARLEMSRRMGKIFFGISMGKTWDKITSYGRLYGRLVYIIAIHIISWCFLWSYWILGAHGHMALQIVISQWFFYLVIMHHILWSDVDDAFSWACFVFFPNFPLGWRHISRTRKDRISGSVDQWIGQVMRALTSSQLWEKSLDLLAGALKRIGIMGSWDPIHQDPVGSSIFHHVPAAEKPAAPISLKYFTRCTDCGTNVISSGMCR